MNQPEKRLGSVKRLEERIQAYFGDCREKEKMPTVTGLALYLGLEGRDELETLAGGDHKQGAALRRARSQVEEETLQAACRRDTATGAKFLLQSGFGYADKRELDVSGGEITVHLTEEE